MTDALLNGIAPDAGLAQSRGLHYGDGVFRTLLIEQGRALDLDLHLAKLRQDCASLQIAAPATATLEAEVRRLVKGQSRAVLKIIVTRRAAGRGYRPATDEADRLLLRSAAPDFPDAHWTRGIALRRSAVILAAQPLLAGVKHLNRLEQVLASRHWPQDVEELLLGDADGHVVGGTRSNLFWSPERGMLATPRLDRAGVEGVTRRKIMDLAMKLEVEVKVVDAPWAALEQAREAFVCNSLIGIWPVRQIDGRKLRHSPGALTRRLSEALAHPRLGR